MTAMTAFSHVCTGGKASSVRLVQACGTAECLIERKTNKQKKQSEKKKHSGDKKTVRGVGSI